MKRRLMAILLLAAMLAACASLLQAQTATTGQIAGQILDPQGAVTVGAQVTLTSEAGAKREVTTDASGRYAFPLLPPASYLLGIAMPGFKSLTVEHVIAKITETTHLDLRLQVAVRQESVVVSAEPPLVQAESPTRGEVIQSGTLRQLPLSTRNFQQLLTLTAGTLGSISNSSELGRGDAVFNVNGQRSVSNAVVINGVDANSIGTGSTPNLAVPATDTLQEFIVQTSLYDASQGRNAGGIVAAVTRSGSNAFHGNLYEFLRNDALNANNYFLNRAGVPRPVYRRNQFGGTLGGRIVKDRAWFFMSYQGTRETNGTSLTNSLATVFVPGNLSNDRSTAAMNALAASFGVAAINPTALFLLQAKLPNGQNAIPSAPSPGASNAAVSVPVPGISKFREDQFNSNLDFQVNSKNRLALKFFWANNPATQALFNSFGTGNALPLPGFGATVDFKQRLLSVSDTHAFGAHVLNEGHFGYSSITTKSTPQEPFTSAQLGIQSPLSSLFPGMPTISVSNYFDLGASPFSDNDAQIATSTIGDALNWTIGRHSLKLGGEYKRQSVDERFDLYTRGNMFDLGFSGNPFTDFLGGFFGLNGLSIMGSGVNTRHHRAQDAAWFINDNWRLTDQLTLTLGLRWDYYGQFHETQGRFVAFDPALLATKAIGGGVAVTGGFVQANNAQSVLPGFTPVTSTLVPADTNNFGPRIGFAWQPFRHDSRMVVRGGFGMYYDRPNARLLNNQILNFPFYTLAQVVGAPISNPFVQVPLPSAFPLQFSNATIFPSGGAPAVLPAAVAASACAPAGFTCVPANGIYPNLHNFLTPYVYQYSLGTQHEFARNWLLDLSYVGASGRRQLRLLDLNQPVAAVAFSPGPLSPGLSALPIQAFGVHVIESSGNSNYNSLQATVTKRFSHGLQLIAAYTFSHNIDDYSGDASGTSDNSVVPGDEVNLHNRASADFDRRHRFVFSYIYDLPKFYHGGSKPASLLANDWELAGILTLQTGTPFSVLTNATAFVQARADFAPGCTPTSAELSGSVDSRLNKYFDTSCFVAATGLGNYGETGRNILRGPDQKNIDFSVVKFFPVGEGKKLEFRSEFFNLFNMTSFANPVNIKASANFGQIVRTSTGSRVIQFAMKFNF